MSHRLVRACGGVRRSLTVAPAGRGARPGAQIAGTARRMRAIARPVAGGESQVSVRREPLHDERDRTVRVRARKSSRARLSARPEIHPPTTRPPGFEVKPKLYVLAVGVSNYADPKLKLAFAAKDASDFAAALGRQKGGLYRDVVVKLLTDERDTKEEVLDGLDWIRKETTSKDVAMVLFAGHGVNTRTGAFPPTTPTSRSCSARAVVEDIKTRSSRSRAKRSSSLTPAIRERHGDAARALTLDIVGVVNDFRAWRTARCVFGGLEGQSILFGKPRVE